MDIESLRTLQHDDRTSFNLLQDSVGQIDFSPLIEKIQSGVPAYQKMEIRKGNGRSRTIHKPDDTLKEIQRQLCALFNALPLYEHVYGFRVATERHNVAGAQRGLRDMLNRYKRRTGKSWIEDCVQFDVRNFFPSIRTEDIDRAMQLYVDQIFLHYPSVSAESRSLLKNVFMTLCTLDDHLPQGAPTSPILSNAASQPMDIELGQIVKDAGGAMGPYADDFATIFPRQIGKSTIRKMTDVLAANGLEEATEKRSRSKKAEKLFIWGMTVLPPAQNGESIRFRVRRNYENELHYRMNACRKSILLHGITDETRHKVFSICGSISHCANVGKHGMDTDLGEETYLPARLEHAWNIFLQTVQTMLPKSAPRWHRKPVQQTKRAA